MKTIHTDKTMKAGKARIITQKTRDKLYSLSGNQCAFPGCEEKLFDTEENRTDSAGICHMEAAEPDGLRYNPDSTRDIRNSYDNLILLCAKHRNETNHVTWYTVDDLRKMKKDHEQKIARRAGNRKKRLFSLPARNPHFTGRTKELEKIHDRFQTAALVALTQSVPGLGGAGKTQIALEYAYRHEDEYDFVWWIGAEDESAIRRSYRSFALAKGLVGEAECTGAKADTVVETVKNWAEKNGKWLIVFDNAEDEKVTAAYLPRQTAGQRRHVLLTSGTPWKKAGRMDIDVFDPEEAAGFLTAYTGLPRDAQQDRLAEALGRLPLALKQAAACMKVDGISCGKYLELFNAVQLPAGTGDDGFRQTVYKTWTVAIKRAGRKSPVGKLLDRLFFFAVPKQSASRQLLGLLAFFGPEPVCYRWLRDNRKHLPRPLRKKMNALPKRNKALAELKKYALVNTENHKISIHGLLRQVIRDSLRNERQDWIRRCLQILDGLAYTDFSTVESRDRFLELAPHIRSVTGQSAEQETETVGNLYQFLGHGLKELSCLPQALEWYLKAIAIREKVLEEDDPDTATTCNHIATVYYNQSMNEKALEWYSRAFTIREKGLGYEHRSTATACNNVAAACYNLGRYAEAVEWYWKDLDITERLLGEEHPDTAIICLSIAAAHDNLKQYDLARDWYLKNLTVREKELGKDHPDLAVTCNNIAYACNKLKEYDSALEWYLRDLTLRQKVLGPEHEVVGTICSNIASVYKNQGKYAEALEWYHKALAIREKALGKKHPYTAITCKHIAEVYKYLGKSAEALEWNLKDSVTSENLLGKEHLSASTTYNDLALVYKNQGKYAKALKMFLATYKVHLAKYGAEHAYTGNVRTKLEWTYNKTAPTQPFEKWLAEKMKESK
ncbi:MAG: tetratricopeptide repeat protein [Tannerella sp.]|jgi:tetratricopeptide (TPR) repeat protein|nr:tetratricopeptide repeat protein [Tannerella sp.]